MYEDKIAPFLSYLFIELKLDKSKAGCYRSQLRIFFDFFTKVPFDRPNFNLFIEALSKKGLKHSTLNTYIALGKNYASYMKSDCLKDYTYFKPEQKIVEILTVGEIKKLAEVKIQYGRRKKYINNMYKTLIYFLATTGCRIEEALSLEWKDVISEPCSVIFRDTKNGYQRAVPIADWLYSLLRTLGGQNKTVFASYRGDKLSASGVRHELLRRAQKISLRKPVYPHIFRHSYITTMLENGVDISDVAVIVGHRDIQSTMTYKHNLMGHYSQVILCHPLLRERLTLTTIQKRVTEYVDRLVDHTKYTINIVQSGVEFKLNIKPLIK